MITLHRRGINTVPHRGSLSQESGQATVEFAFILPLLVLLVFAVFQFSIVFKNWIVLTRAVSTGGRVAAVCRFTGADIAQAVRSAAPTLDATGVLDVPAVSCPAAGQSVTVEARYPYSINIPFLGGVFSGTLDERTVERVE